MLPAAIVTPHFRTHENSHLERQFAEGSPAPPARLAGRAATGRAVPAGTKQEDHNFPRAEIEAAGYQVAFSGQKTYNGVALLARQPITRRVCGNPHFPDEQKRLIAGTVGDTRVICAYMPNGQAVGSDKYDYKLRWLDALARLGRRGSWPPTRNWRCVAITTLPRTTATCTTPKPGPADSLFRTRTRRLPAPARPRPEDSFRLFEQPEKTYSWWDYRMLGFQKNQGLRIDHVLLSKALAETCTPPASTAPPASWSGRPITPRSGRHWPDHCLK
jgi:exodeoxyribonuclease-3